MQNGNALRRSRHRAGNQGSDVQRCWHWPVIGTLLLALALSAGCTRIHTEKGIDPAWNQLDPDTFRSGESTQSDVMALLGPPSQIISHQDGAIFYYLHEEAVGTGMIFILYNQGQLNTRYDRAIFFFDAAGVLQDHAISTPPRQAE
jgi:outer membrane protein assembly factor BamE (lipoprotein component of BamABCDE complex)